MNIISAKGGLNGGDLNMKFSVTFLQYDRERFLKNILTIDVRHKKYFLKLIKGSPSNFFYLGIFREW